ncbi:TonB-dependent siderophore receptor [Flavivirga sp. 57AJ16]|uniref:TonB-dependent siderophore receptor n=1 Tax=Flavivirga sp. 57AJ16 TaxID=3025307 RepID=UPI0023665A16|nr:TonB-dependent siderophore receptor [Flavivirga sp. 57AJ16]MDD7886947.1 TonB-dependent siderophore receptor [Flavivirga sp. 57AJ16]
MKYYRINTYYTYVLKLSIILLIGFTSQNTNAQNTLLGKEVSLTFNNETLASALTKIEEQVGCTFSYSPTSFKTDRLIKKSYSKEPLREVLNELFVQHQIYYRIRGNTIHIQNHAEKGQVSGKITTVEGNAASFVSVLLKGTRIGTTTDENGFFSFSVPEGEYIILTSSIGLKQQSKPITIIANNNTKVNFTLSETSEALQEVVLTGNRKQYKVEKVSKSLRIQTPIIETPQSIIAIDGAIMEDQQIFTITDVSRNVSGVTNLFPYVGVYTDFSIRGSRATRNRLRNGMSPGYFNALQEDMSYVESVEFIKGPAGFMLAQGEPGGMYNVVTKKPLGKQHAGITLSTGSYGLFRTALDVGGTVGKDKKLNYRLNVMNQNSGTYLDNGINNRFSVAPVIRYDFNEKTSLTLEYNYDHAVVNGTFNNLPTKNGQFLPRNFMLEDPTQDPYTFNSNFGFVNLQHQLSNNWNLTAQIGTSFGNREGTLFYASTTPGIDDNGMLARNYRYLAGEDKTNTAQVFLNGNVKTAKLEHKLLIGFDGGLGTSKSAYAQASDVLPIDVNNPVYGLSTEIDALLNEEDILLGNPSEILWEAITIQDNIKFNEWLQVTLGGRFTHYENGGRGKVMKDDAFTPRAGVIIQPIENTSVYFLYDQSFVAQSSTDVNGNRFEPLRGNNIELGVKKEWFDKKLFTQVAVFNITKNNALTTDPDNPGFNIQRGQIQSKGVEVDVLGSITDNLNIVANYAYIDAKITEDTNPLIVGTRQQGPLHHFNTWLKYQFTQGTLNGFGLGLGGSLQKDRYVFTSKLDPSEEDGKLDDFKSLNAALYYKVNKLSFALNVDNITDNFNYIGTVRNNSGVSGTDQEISYISMPGTNWRLSVAYKF